MNNNEIIGDLCAVNTIDVLRNITDASMFEDGGYSNIIKSDGECDQVYVQKRKDLCRVSSYRNQ